MSNVPLVIYFFFHLFIFFHPILPPRAEYRFYIGSIQNAYKRKDF